MKFRNLAIGLILLFAGVGLTLYWLSTRTGDSQAKVPPPASGSQLAAPSPDKVAEPTAPATSASQDFSSRSILPPTLPAVAKATGSTGVASAAGTSASAGSSATQGAGLHFAADRMQGKVPGLANSDFFMRQFGSNAPKGATVDQLKSRPPIAIYDLSAAAITRGVSLDSLLPDGLYLYQLEYSGSVIGWVEVNSSAASMADIKSFNLVGSQIVADAVEAVLAMPQFQTGSYEVRLLAIGGGVRGFGGNQAKALWLKADGGGTDYIYTPGNFPNARIGQNKLYTSADFMSTLGSVSAGRRNGRGARGGSGGAT